jgi:catechol 2,3-dioxygenase
VARVPVSGASDHGVSEAIYLSDPEGNGVEIYADRQASSWTWINGTVDMVSEALDFDSLIAASEAAEPWKGAPAGTTIGHVHLQVGAIAPAEAFYAEELGLDITCRYPGATFFATNGYHHHIATNIWNSRGAEKRSYPSTGLAEIELRLDTERGKHGSISDPWGNVIALA